jgi:quinol monooxygenase YgiN
MIPVPLTDSPVMSVLEATVPANRWFELAEMYRKASEHIPPQMVHTSLVQSTTEPSRWQTISIWRSRAALEEYRRSVQTPAGIAMFQDVGAYPEITLRDVGAASAAAPLS